MCHGDLSQALEDAGGWLGRDTAQRSADYAGLVAGALGDALGLWITLNEPWVSAWLGCGTGRHAPGGRSLRWALAATDHLLLGHGLAAQAVRVALRGAQVGLSCNLYPIEAATEHPDDRVAAERVSVKPERHVRRADLPGTLSGRRVPPGVLPRGRRPGTRRGLEVVAAPVDFLGVNYSPTGVVWMLPVRPGLLRVEPPGQLRVVREDDRCQRPARLTLPGGARQGDLGRPRQPRAEVIRKPSNVTHHPLRWQVRDRWW